MNLRMMFTITAIYLVVCVSALVMALNTVFSIMSASPPDHCDFGCGFQLTFTVLPVAAVSAISTMVWYFFVRSSLPKNTFG